MTDTTAPPSASGPPERASLRPVGAFTFLYLAVALAVYLSRGNAEFLVYICFMLAIMVLVWQVHRRAGLTRGALWALSAWGLAHMAGGIVHVPEGWPTNEGSRVLYALWIVPGYLKYDHIVHAFGFGVTTWVCWQCLSAALEARGPRSRPSAGLLVLAAASGMGFGAMNEVLEFLLTRFVPETGVGGYVNTGWDLVANLVGAAAAVFLIRWRHGRVYSIETGGVSVPGGSQGGRE